MSDPKNPEGLPDDAEQAAAGAVPPAASDPDVPSVPEPPAAPEPPQAPPAPPAPPAPEPPQYAAPAAPEPPAAPTPPPSYGAPAAPSQSSSQQGYGQTPPGYGAADYSGYSQAPAQKSPVLSIISLIAGIVGIVGGGIVLIPIVGAILQLFIPAAAVVLGFLGKKKEPQAKGMWLTGIILGFIGILIALAALVFWIVVIGVAANDPNMYQFDYDY
ncbi:hypothetical protein [Agromyces archimandritae]|uniref:DUF4190 domain-containing protein n=1 Tax=Agromyces archimandritae TaxID=2781962 RepID=A0A975IPB1_9MICO|nr:hypothetical protein [Agromyces archimandritae]QTX05452.1 hypothetical protein G127AT_04345 [Agromyces archimandritae]